MRELRPAVLHEIYYLNFQGASDAQWALQITPDYMAWKTMLTDPETPEAVAALKAYREAKDDPLATAYSKSRLWDDYCEICMVEMDKKTSQKAAA